MGHKAKVRAYATISGRKRELFAVRELGDGSLVMMIATSLHAVDGKGSMFAYDAEHHSVHRSNGGKDTTFTQKTRLKAGTELAAVAFVPDTQKRLLWVLRSERMHHVNEFRDFTPRAKDEVHHIAEYDQEKCTFLFCITIANADYRMPPPEADSAFLVHKEILIGFYKIIVSTSFFHYPTIHSGSVTFNATSTANVDGRPIGGFRERKAAVSAPDDILYQLIGSQFGDLMREWVSCLVKVNGIPLPIAVHALSSRTLHAEPLK